MPKRKLPDDKIVIDLYLSGLSCTQVAKSFGLANGSPVAKLLERNNIQARSNSDSKKLSFKNGQKISNYWKGKKQPPEMVEKRISKIRGEKHYLWKGGKDKREYRNLIKKEQCELCPSKNNLGIHHKDFDHYNDEITNLQVLCVSCHMKLHKQAYWDSIKNNTKYKSNAPIGWNKNQ